MVYSIINVRLAVHSCESKKDVLLKSGVIQMEWNLIHEGHTQRLHENDLLPVNSYVPPKPRWPSTHDVLELRSKAPEKRFETKTNDLPSVNINACTTIRFVCWFFDADGATLVQRQQTGLCKSVCLRRSWGPMPQRLIRDFPKIVASRCTSVEEQIRLSLQRDVTSQPYVYLRLVSLIVNCQNNSL